ncbi:MAG: hypothetical protein ACPGSN_12365 [Psychrobium sp.]
MNIIEVIKKIDQYEISFEDFALLSEGDDLANFINSFSMTVAQQFMADNIDFDVADGAINYVWDFMINDVFGTQEGNSVPSPAYDIYDAFDMGEYHHSGDPKNVCPVEKYTKPYLDEILREYSHIKTN